MEGYNSPSTFPTGYFGGRGQLIFERTIDASWNDHSRVEHSTGPYRTNGSAVDAALVQAASATTAEGIAVGKLISNALTGGSPLSTVFPTTGLGAQWQQVARVIQVRSQLRMNRQIFFCSMGGFDTHSNQLNDQNNLFAELSPALTAFYNATAALGVANEVTALPNPGLDGRASPVRVPEATVRGVAITW